MRLRRTNAAPLGAAVVLIAPLSWGVSLPATKVALDTLDAQAFLAWSRVLGLVMMLAALLIGRRLALVADRRLILPGLTLGLLLSGAVLLQTLGLERTSATNTSFITGLYVVLVPVFSIAFGRSASARRAFPAVPVAVVGIGLLSLDGFALHAGDLLVLVSAFALAAHFLALAHWAPRFDPLVLAAVQMAAAGAVHIALLTPGGADVDGALSIWPLIAINGVLGSGVAYLVQIRAQSRMCASRTALILCLEAVTGAACSALWIGDRLGVREWLGAMLLLAAVALSEVRSRRDGVEHTRARVLGRLVERLDLEQPVPLRSPL